jgi:hypothetical protein
MISTKMADQVIVGVHYSSPVGSRRIESVILSQDLSTLPLPKLQMYREEVVRMVRQNPQGCYTAFLEHGVWKRGARVEIVTIFGVGFLRTDSNRRTEDNLENLREF